MTRTEIALAVLVIAALVAVLLAVSGTRPRVTEITRRVEREEPEERE